MFLSWPIPQGKRSVLMSVISGEAVPSIRDMEDKDVADQCVKVLRELFKEQVLEQLSTTLKREPHITLGLLQVTF